MLTKLQAAEARSAACEQAMADYQQAMADVQQRNIAQQAVIESQRAESVWLQQELARYSDEWEASSD